MDISRRNFIKIVGLETAGLFIGTPLSSRADFWEHSGTPLSDKIAGLTMRVIGVGFAGCNMLDFMIKKNDLNDIDFIGSSYDPSYLEKSSFPSKILLGENLGNPFGLGGDAELAYTYTMASCATIRRRLKGSDLMIILAGMGGNTGTGGAPVVARISKDLGAWTIAIVTMPFGFEGKRRSVKAQKGHEQLKSIVDTTIVIHNNAILPLLSPSSTALDAFRKSDEIAYRGVKAFSNIPLTPRMLAMGFTDIKSAFSKGIARIGYF